MIISQALEGTQLEIPARIMTTGRMPGWQTDPRWTLTRLAPMIDTQKYPSSDANLGSAAMVRVLRRKPFRRNFW